MAEFLRSQDFITCRRLSAFHESYEFYPVPFELLPEKYSICRLSVESHIEMSARVMSVTRSEHEASVICLAGHEPEGAETESGWRALRIAQKLNFGVVGVVARIATLLAAARVSVFVMSTYDTDYFFIKEQQKDSAIEALRDAQYEVRTHGQ